MKEPSCEAVLAAAIGVKLRKVVVIGELADGYPYVATSGNADALLLMERAKQYLVSVYESYLEDDSPKE